MKQQVKDALLNVKPEVNVDSSQLISDGELDSLDIMNLVMELEDTFDIEIDPEDVMSDNFESVEAIVALVEKCKNNPRNISYLKDFESDEVIDAIIDFTKKNEANYSVLTQNLPKTKENSLTDEDKQFLALPLEYN